MRDKTPLPDRYESLQGRTISKSKSHKDLWIIETSKGWFSISSTDDVMRSCNPPKPIKQ